MKRALCVHLHCYQPPRANPWTGRTDPEPSAAPYSDWNERITDECYRPNGHARVLDDGDARFDNYKHTSWDVGPTLHTWSAANAPDVDAQLRAADAEAMRLRHAAAVAAPAIHAILPLAAPRDRDTLVAWGVHDFRYRFGRNSSGCWLPECAVDIGTLETLVDHGFRFTILTPEQAARVRRPGGEWKPMAPERLDTAKPYLALLPSGRSITIFFANGPVSRAIAFEALLSDGARFATAIRERFDDRPDPQLVAVVTDGETFGHHHKFGEMALAWALRAMRQEGVEVTTFAAYLETRPAVDEVEIVDPSSWSCAHGIGRWRTHCGCVTGGDSGWQQEWRAPLRAAIDWFVTASAEQYHDALADRVEHPWELRNDYGRVVSGEQLAEPFLAAHSLDESVEPWLRSQFHTLAATTSCGWFFADPAGIETGIILKEAARAMDLIRDSGGEDLEPEFLARLEPMRSNDLPALHGRALWHHHVDAARGSLSATTAR